MTLLHAKKIASFTACTLSFVSAFSADANDKKPNILFVLVDDLGWNDLTCMGSTFYETPNIDRIARNGVKFTQGYAGCSVSSPSRASILTGKTPARHGITSWIGDLSGESWREKKHYNKMLPADYSHSMNAEEYTIAEALSDNGYSTSFVGKWHLGDKVSPLDYGFDVNIGGWASGAPKGGYFSPYKNPALSDGPYGENLTMRLSQEVIGQIEQSKKEDKPFFTFLSFYAVHAPIQTTQERWDYYRQKAISQHSLESDSSKEFGKEEGFYKERILPARSRQDNPIYAGLIEQLDIAVGNVLDYLERADLLENTIIVFTSDNGGVVSGDNFSTSLKPLRGGKGMQWEGGIRVPFLIWNPTMEYNVSIIEQPVISMDLYPTLLDMAGIPSNPKQHIDGLSLVPLMSGKLASNRALFWHFPHYGNQGGEPSSIVRDGDWKLIYYHEDGRYELYNLASDLGEQTDRSDINSQKRDELINKLNFFLSDTDATMPTLDPMYNKQKEFEASEKRMLQAKKRQEFQRTNQFSPTWKPNETWWDSLPFTFQ